MTDNVLERVDDLCAKIKYALLSVRGYIPKCKSKYALLCSHFLQIKAHIMHSYGIAQITRPREASCDIVRVVWDIECRLHPPQHPCVLFISLMSGRRSVTFA
jgi:hypothetical protein